MAIEDGHGRLVPILMWSNGVKIHQNGTDSLCDAHQDAVLDGPGRDPVEHPRAVILHLRLDEVKVPRLTQIKDDMITITWMSAAASVCT